MAHTVILVGQRQRDYAHRLIDAAPDSYVMTLREGTRTTEQNDKMWAMLGDISRAKPEGRVMIPDRWKGAFMSALGHEVLWEAGIDGGPPFPVGFRSSKLSKRQMADLITFIQEYGDRHGVRWSDGE